MDEQAGGRATVGAVGRATPTQKPAKASHFAEFAHHFLKMGQPMATGALVAVFQNHGNTLEGATPEARQRAAEAALVADERLDYSDELDAWILKPADAA